MLITGAGSGIGLATARIVTAEGGRVALVDRDGAAANKAAAELPGSIAIEADVSDAEQVKAAFDRTVAELGGVDIVHNNAAIRVDCTSSTSTTGSGFPRSTATDRSWCSRMPSSTCSVPVVA